ncbi:MAG: SIR2 family protein [Gemmatimonadetes bacterium]|nr:SIR2 family protein [Gemmatimonadota bacterium]
MQIPSSLVQDIRQGRVVLFLGAGASLGALTKQNARPPLADELRDRLSDRFLGGNFKKYPLSQVADLAISETDLVTVQEFVADQVRGLLPADFHRLIPTFKWRGIFTTNYDRVVETAYDVTDSRAQDVVPIFSDSDRLDERLRSQDQLALLKLHGCVTRTHDPELPLILTADQYITHRKNRQYLFRTLDQWAYEYPVVFVGHGLQDTDIRAVLLEVSKDLAVRPRHYLVVPGASNEEVRFWEGKKVSVLDGTFEDFLRKMEQHIPEALRPLLQQVDYEHPIKARFVVNENIGQGLRDLITQDVEYVYEGMAIGEGRAKAFYRGFDLGWYAIEQRYDVRRRLTDTLLTDVIIRPEEDRPTRAELYLIKAEAGAGKSVFLKRLAWEAARDADALCLYVREAGFVQYEALQELYRVTQQRVFLFFDNAADHVSSLLALITKARRDRIPITFITAERVNAWNMSCQALNEYLNESFHLKYLSRSEIETLVGLLEQHDSLGPNLIGKSFDEQVEQFHEQAGRQLLVALHEATLGPPFEDILFDEFNEIQPQAARSLYLTVCVLNRMNVPVRAGLIARVHQIPFEDFRQKLFEPLDHVVQTRLGARTGDYYYMARHPEVAQIVFERVLNNPTDRYHEYIRIIRELNPSYSSDRESFRGLIRAKSLHDLFPDYQDVRALYDLAQEVAPRDAYVYQQRANYERIRPNGNYQEAQKLLEVARELDPKDTSITHTLAELTRTQAEAAENPLQRERFRTAARRLLQPLVNDQLGGRYARTTAVKLTIDALRDILADNTASDREIDEAIRVVENPLQRWLQEHPDDPHLLTAEADFSTLLRDNDRSVRALRRAFEANPRDRYVTIRLARVLEDKGDLEGARDMLRAALDANRGDRALNFRYAMVLRELGVVDRATLLHHLRRAFTEGDTNHEAQFWYARYAFESVKAEDRDLGRELFKRLREIPMAHEARLEIRDTIAADNGPTVFAGAIVRLEAAYGFAQRDGVADWIFVHRNNVEEADWGKLRLRTRVAFNIGFSYAGVRALNLEPIEP